MKQNHKTIAGAALLGFALLTATFAVGQTAVKETTTTTSLGTFSELGPETLLIRSSDSPDPVAYTFTKTTTYVDEAGMPVSVQTVKSGQPVTVHYSRVGDKMIATRVIVRKAVIQDNPMVEEKKTTTTTTTSDK